MFSEGETRTVEFYSLKRKIIYLGSSLVNRLLIYPNDYEGESERPDLTPLKVHTIIQVSTNYGEERYGDEHYPIRSGVKF